MLSGAVSSRLLAWAILGVGVAGVVRILSPDLRVLNRALLGGMVLIVVSLVAWRAYQRHGPGR